MVQFNKNKLGLNFFELKLIWLFHLLCHASLFTRSVNSRVVVVVFCFQIHHFKRCVYAAVLSETIVVLGGYWGG